MHELVHICSYVKNRFSHDAAQLIYRYLKKCLKGLTIVTMALRDLTVGFLPPVLFDGYFFFFLLVTETINF